MVQQLRSPLFFTSYTESAELSLPSSRLSTRISPILLENLLNEINVVAMIADLRSVLVV
jgi:hypothetical protein